MSNTLGKPFAGGEVIIREGELGDCMYVIQSGEVEIVKQCEGKEITIGIRRDGDFFGEGALFARQTRDASVRAKGPVHVLTIDKKNLLRRIQADPSLAFRLIETMSHRIQELSDGVTFLAATAAHREQKK